MKPIKKIKLIIITLICLISINNNSFAQRELNPSYQDRYCNELQLGWDFYCDRESKPEEEEQKQESKTKPEAPKDPTPYEKILKIREELNNLHAQSVLEPTEENIYNYEKFKLEQLDKASTVAQATERMWWKHPELNYLLKRPTGTVAKKAWLEQRGDNVEDTLTNLSKRYSLIYFFRSDCTICRKFSPTLKGLTDTYQINIRAVSMDGGKSSVFKDYKIDQGESQKLGVTVVPTLFLFDHTEKNILPLGAGFIARTQLEERIHLVTKVKVGDDY